MARRKYFQLIQKPNEKDLKIFPVRLINLPKDLVEDSGNYIMDLVDIREKDINLASVIWLRKSTKSEFDDFSKEYTLENSGNMYFY